MYCKAKVNNGSVVIYYGVNGIMRFPTGVKISKDKDKQNKFKEWDSKKNMVSSDVENATKMNKVIADWITKADDIVSRSLIDGIKITAPELEKELTDIREGKIQVKSELFMVNYSDFMERKRTQLFESVGKSDISFINPGAIRNNWDKGPMYEI